MLISLDQQSVLLVYLSLRDCGPGSGGLKRPRLLSAEQGPSSLRPVFSCDRVKQQLGAGVPSDRPQGGNFSSNYSAASRPRPKTGNLMFGPTEQLQMCTTRFSRALEVYSSNDPVPGSEVYRGTEHLILKIAISHTNVDRYGAPGTVFSINADM